jgi:hypothetical protein
MIRVANTHRFETFGFSLPHDPVCIENGECQCIKAEVALIGGHVGERLEPLFINIPAGGISRSVPDAVASLPVITRRVSEGNARVDPVDGFISVQRAG